MGVTKTVASVSAAPPEYMHDSMPKGPHDVKTKAMAERRHQLRDLLLLAAPATPATALTTTFSGWLLLLLSLTVFTGDVDDVEDGIDITLLPLVADE
jgi:hypothetical protein